MWPRISIENSMQIHSVLVILVIAIFCPIANAARLTVDASGDLRFGSNTVTLKGDLSVQGVSVLDSFTSLDTTLVQSDLYNLYRLNALRIQKFDYNLSSSAVFATNGETYMVATSLTASTFYLFKWNNASLNFDSPSTTPFPGAPGACIGNSVKVLQTNSSETYVLFACNGAVPVYTYKFISGSLSSSQASFSADAPRGQYGLSVGASDASAIQHSSGTIFYTQMTAAGSANNIYRTVGTAQPVWSGNNTNAATASHFFTIGTTLYAAIGYSNVNYTQIVYTTDGLNFTNHHTIPSYLVADIDTFVSGNTTYMLVTESVPESKLIANQTGLVSVSEVYKWNGTGFSRLTGDVIVQNPHNSKIFTFQDNIFLVVSNSYASSADYAAQLFRWNKVVEEFTLICSITNVSNNYWWEGFSVGGKSYLVLNTAAKTFVYKLNLN